MDTYKYDGMSEEDRNSLIPGISGQAVNPEPEKRDAFVRDLVQSIDRANAIAELEKRDASAS